MRRPLAFRTMLLANLAAFALLPALALGWLMLVGVRKALYQNLDQTLLEIAATELASATDTGYVHVHDTMPMFLEVNSHPGYEKHVWIEDANEGLLARTPNLAGKPLPRTEADKEAAAKKGKVGYGWAEVEGVRMRAVYFPGTDAMGHRLIAVVAVPVEPLEESIASAARWIQAIALAAAAAGLLLAWRLANRLSRPLKAFADASQRVGEPGGPASIAIPKAPREIEDAAEATNRMLHRLQQARTEQERLVERLREFMADFSHEVRTPLANVVGTAEVCLRKSRSSEEYREALEVVRAETDRAVRLVNDMLLLARADVGQLPSERQRFPLAKVVREAVVVAQKAVPDLKWQVELDWACEVCADPRQMRQVFGNILDNVCRHARSSVRVAVFMDEGRAVAVFENDGPRLSDEEQERLFERFYRGDASRARSSGGSGLGLAIVKSLVALHRGSISASNLEQGVRFTIVLPPAENDPACCPPYEGLADNPPEELGGNGPRSGT